MIELPPVKSISYDDHARSSLPPVVAHYFEDEEDHKVATLPGTHVAFSKTKPSNSEPDNTIAHPMWDCVQSSSGLSYSWAKSTAHVGGKKHGIGAVNHGVRDKPPRPGPEIEPFSLRKNIQLDPIPFLSRESTRAGSLSHSVTPRLDDGAPRHLAECEEPSPLLASAPFPADLRGGGGGGGHLPPPPFHTRTSRRSPAATPTTPSQR
ncbi:unnamed protein product [Phytomonas sp. Hart1]|nr:unnamed protein product [Phytomonas sp. Hart1]|eukprot:CCW72254.1 unnamed protein product [Phytomonas sp. isolate Hart1]